MEDNIFLVNWYISNRTNFIKDFCNLGIENTMENKIEFALYLEKQEKYSNMEYRCMDVV